MTIRAERLRLAIGERLLCAGADFEAGAGQLWCLLGRNGAGKTTLLRTLAGLRPAQGGALLFNDRALSDWSWQDLARARAFMPQRTHDSFRTTVLELVLGAGYARRGARRLGSWFDNDEERSAARAVLDELGLGPFASRDLLSLSGGERQRVALAAALMQDSALLLLDEPLAHLDLDMQLAALKVLQARLARGTRPATVVMSLHDVNLAARAATHVLLFAEAGTVRAGPTEAVLTAEHLSDAFCHPVREIRDGAQRWFAAQ